MRRSLSLALIMVCCFRADAQNKNNVYLDLGLNEIGLSATYDRKVARHFDAGIGVNTYHFFEPQYGESRGAIYADIRPFWNRKRSLWFAFADIGLALNGGKMPDSVSMDRGSFYFSVGAGYCYKINKRGWGPYVTLGLYNYNEHMHIHSAYLPPRARDYSVEDGWGILSVGFKF